MNEVCSTHAAFFFNTHSQTVKSNHGAWWSGGGERDWKQTAFPKKKKFETQKEKGCRVVNDGVGRARWVYNYVIPAVFGMLGVLNGERDDAAVDDFLLFALVRARRGQEGFEELLEVATHQVEEFEHGTFENHFVNSLLI